MGCTTRSLSKQTAPSVTSEKGTSVKTICKKTTSKNVASKKAISKKVAPKKTNSKKAAPQTARRCPKKVTTYPEKCIATLLMYRCGEFECKTNHRKRCDSWGLCRVEPVKFSTEDKECYFCARISKCRDKIAKKRDELTELEVQAQIEELRFEGLKLPLKVDVPRFGRRLYLRDDPLLGRLQALVAEAKLKTSCES